jgi:hypothetical protein
MRSELLSEIQLLKDKLGSEEKSVLRLQHAEELGQRFLHGELTDMQSMFAGQLTQMQGSVQQANRSVFELNEQLVRDRQQHAAETEALLTKLERAQKLAEENVSCAPCIV